MAAVQQRLATHFEQTATSTFTLETLRNLRILRVNGNRLRSLKGLECLPSLEELHAADNEIDHIDESLFLAASLRTLNVAAN